DHDAEEVQEVVARSAQAFAQGPGATTERAVRGNDLGARVGERAVEQEAVVPARQGAAVGTGHALERALPCPSAALERLGPTLGVAPPLDHGGELLLACDARPLDGLDFLASTLLQFLVVPDLLDLAVVGALRDSEDGVGGLFERALAVGLHALDGP